MYAIPLAEDYCELALVCVDIFLIFGTKRVKANTHCKNLYRVKCPGRMGNKSESRATRGSTYPELWSEVVKYGLDPGRTRCRPVTALLAWKGYDRAFV